jgi:hypothetical protein
VPIRDEYCYVDPQGKLVVSADVAARYGFKPGAKLKFDQGPNSILLQRPITHLARVYVEPTTKCNLECRACIRHAWSDPLGAMSWATYLRVLQGLRAISPVPVVFFGGFGESLAHPDIYRMIRAAKELGAVAELITNGTLLDDGSVQALLEAGLDTLWVSIDGATAGATAATIRTAIVRTVSAARHRPAAAASGPRDSSAVPSRELQALLERQLNSLQHNFARIGRAGNCVDYKALLVQDMPYDRISSMLGAVLVFEQ